MEDQQDVVMQMNSESLRRINELNLQMDKFDQEEQANQK